MTIKQDIEREAAKAGAAVRVALQEFANATGMQAQIGVTWVNARMAEGLSGANHLASVEIDVGGMAVQA